MAGYPIGITFGAWDLLHPGHTLFLQQCKTWCDHLIVGLQIDPSKERPDTKKAPVQTPFEREVQLRACRYVDDVHIYGTEAELETMLWSTPAKVRFLGADYTHGYLTGKKACEERDIDIRFIPRSHKYSSSELRDRLLMKT